VGLSGGVDSAVSAGLLKEAGFDVTGVFIKAWQADFLPCNWREERRDAMKVAIALDIPFLSLDLGEEYKRGVVDKIIEEYKVGRTPNPDVLCNREVKFGVFWKKAKELGADYIATGHYAQISEEEKEDSDELALSAKGQRGILATNTNSSELLEGVDGLLLSTKGQGGKLATDTNSSGLLESGDELVLSSEGQGGKLVTDNNSFELLEGENNYNVQKSTEVSQARDLPSSRADALRDAFPKHYNYSLKEGGDKSKDQSYFLWTLTQDDLAHTLFPVGHLEKSEVRKLAEKFGLPVAEKKDSQGICFLGDISMDEFLSHFIETKKGDVLNISGEVIGTHDGALYYTIGERRGFDITKKDALSGAFYVVSKDMKANTITVSNVEKEINDLAPKKVLLRDVNWINKPQAHKPLWAKIRHGGEKIGVVILENTDGIWEVEFNEPVRGLSLGQSIVFYQGEECLGGAIMDKEVIISKHE